MFNYHLFTADVKDRRDAIVHEVSSFTVSTCVKIVFIPNCDLGTPTSDGEITRDGLIWGLNINFIFKSLLFRILIPLQHSFELRMFHGGAHGY